MKPRVLQFIGSFHQGGSERQALQLSRLLKQAGKVELYIATLDTEGPLRVDVEKLRVGSIAEFPLNSFYDLSFIRQLIRCAKYLRKSRIDLVHTHDFYTNVFGMFAARLAGVECRVASKRETGGMRTKSQDRVERLAFRLSDQIVANSLAVKNQLVGKGINLGKISVIYNGLDTSRFEAKIADRGAVAKELGLPDDDTLRFVTMVANLRHGIKNHPMLLRAAKRLSERYEDIHFVIAGEGGLEPEMRQLAENLGLADRVHFIGRCNKVPELLSISFAGVLTSFAEGFSNAILEYMAAGLPVVATEVGGAAEAVEDGVTGYLIPSDSDAAMAEKLEVLLADPDKAARMGRQGRETAVKHFSEEAQLAAITELYLQLTKKRMNDGN